MYFFQVAENELISYLCDGFQVKMPPFDWENYHLSELMTTSEETATIMLIRSLVSAYFISD